MSKMPNQTELMENKRYQQFLWRDSKIVKHFKGEYYIVLGVVFDTEAESWMVRYSPLDNANVEFVRPVGMFFEELDPSIESDQKYRMEFVDFKPSKVMDHKISKTYKSSTAIKTSTNIEGVLDHNKCDLCSEHYKYIAYVNGKLRQVCEGCMDSLGHDGKFIFKIHRRS